MLLSAHLYAEERTGNNNRHNDVTIEPLPSLAVNGPEGVSAPFAGRIADKLVVAGGCNFPDMPAAQGGKKMFYDQVFGLTDPLSGEGGWAELGSLPVAAAYGVSINVSEGLLCIGGTDGSQSLDNVWLLSERNGGIDVRPLTPLPVALDNMAGAAGGGYIYVAGGLNNGTPVNKAFRISLSNLNGNWEELPDFPGNGRVQAVAGVQNDGTGPCFYLMGGYQPALNNDTCTIHTNGLRYDPRLRTWHATSAIHIAGEAAPRALIGAAGTASGCAHLIFGGGVDAERFRNALNRPMETAEAMARGDEKALARLSQEADEYLRHPAAWYKFNDELIIYHTLTNTWVTEARFPQLGRAGAAWVDYDGAWVIVNGESKPGIRSADVTALRMTRHVSFGALNWTVLAAYLLGMLLLGYYFMRREGSSDDFFKGGGRIPWWAAGISIYATMLSAITYMAYPAKAFATDWTYYPMLVTILLVSFPVIRYYLPFFRRLNVTSAYEYLEKRFNAATRLMASALFIIFMVARMALVLYLPSLALTAVTGIDIYTCIVLMGLVTIVYCTMGGVEAVIWGDVVQGFILVGGAIFAVSYLIGHTEGGLSGFLTIGIADEKFRLFDWSLDYRSATFWVVILGGMANNLISYTSNQTVIQRYLTTKDEHSARQSILMNGVMSVVISVAFFAIGAGLYTFFKTHPAELDFTMAKSDIIFPFFMMSQLPAGLAGLLIAAIFAATMSTISSNINSVATAFSVDFYKRWRPATSDKAMVRIARRACIVSGILGMGIALLMATWEILSLLDFFQEILGLLSSGLGGLFLMGIFFPRINGRAALAGFLCGVGAVFLTKYFTQASFLLYGFIGMTVSVLTAWLLSFVCRSPKDLKGLTWHTLEDK